MLVFSNYAENYASTIYKSPPHRPLCNLRSPCGRETLYLQFIDFPCGTLSVKNPLPIPLILITPTTK